MDNSNTSLRLRGALIMAAAIILVNIVGVFSLGALFARQEGLGIGAAAARSLRELPVKLLPLLGIAIGTVALLAVLSRKSAGARTPLEAGQERWRRTSLWVTALMAPALIVLAVTLLCHAAEGRWQDEDWIWAFLLVILAPVLIAHWTRRPSPELLHALGTGDDSRINDERVQLVRGKAAQTTLNVFALALLLGGLVYESLVLGVWPILTGSAVVVLASILAIATAYWNRRI